MFTWLRKIILAAALAASVAPALAQAPGPVPGLPDSERRTTYSISGSTCACNVNFALYGDGTDYGNWLEVWLNGALIPSSAYTITSPSGPLSSLARPITDAILTFNAAQTGTVQIVGARRPRRVSQYGTTVPARDLNRDITDLVAQNRENWDKTNDVTGRVPRVPPGETQSQWPPAASRANMSAIFDGSGNLVPGVAVSGSTFSAGNGITFTGTNPTTIASNLLAGTGISISGTNPLTITATAGASVLYVRPQDYGAACDGVTNDATAFQNMVNASSGKTIFIPPGTCVIGSTINLVAKTTIIGANWSSIIKSTVVNNPTFSATNISDVVLSNFSIQGTNNSSGWASASNFGPFSVNVNNLAAGAIGNIQFTRMKLTGFNATYWVYISIGNTAPSILQDVKFDDNYIVTDSSNVPSDANAAANGNYGFVFFGGTTQSMRRASFSRNKIQSTGMCFPIILFGNVSFANIDGNEIDSPGQTSSGHCISGTGTINAYGVAVYDLYGNGNTASNYSISNNVINAPYSSGIYIVGNSNTSANAVIANNVIDQQTSTDNATLPRGAIAINGAGNLAITGNAMHNGFGGIAVAAVNANTISISGNACYTAVGNASSYCYRQTPATGASNTETVNLIGNSFYMNNTGTAVLLINSTVSNKFNNVLISGNQIYSAAGATGINAGNQFFSDHLDLRGNVFSGGGTAASVSSISGFSLWGNSGLSFTQATLPAAGAGSSVFVSDGTPASSPCTGSSTGSTAFRQNSAWKCF